MMKASHTEKTVYAAAAGGSRNATYEVNFRQRDLLGEVLPAALPLLLEVLQESQSRAEILKEMSGRVGNSPIKDVFAKLNALDSSYPDNWSNSVGQSTSPLISPDLQEREFQGNRHTRFVDGINNSGSCTTLVCNPSKDNLKLKLRKRYIAILATGICFGTILASCIALFFVWLYTGHKDINFFDGFYATCSPVIALGHYLVRSLDEYNVFAHKLKDIQSSVSIVIKEPSDWPMGVYIENSGFINGLHVTGSLHGNKLIGLLSQLPALSDLAISNDCNTICSKTQQRITQLESQTINLPLKILHLEKFTPSCESLLEILASQVKFNSLEKFVVEKGSFDKYGASLVHNILEGSKNTLKRMEFLDTTIDVELHTPKGLTVYASVTSVKYDVVDTSSSGTLPKGFCKRFPNLQHFSFGDRPRSWNDILNILECRNLKSLHFSLEMPEKQANFSLPLLADNFPKLESADITLLYPRCNDAQSGNYVLGRNSLPEVLLINLGITSNCNLIHE